MKNLKTQLRLASLLSLILFGVRGGPQEGHGWRKREDQIDALPRTVEWFNQYLGTKAASISPRPAN
jgi:hypothetical protein